MWALGGAEGSLYAYKCFLKALQEEDRQKIWYASKAEPVSLVGHMTVI
jgi:hypothetical protein